MRWRKSWISAGCVTAALAASQARIFLQADEPQSPGPQPTQQQQTTQQPTQPAAKPEPKPLSASATKGLAYLITQQDASGGWGQGGGWRANTQGNGGRVEGDNAHDRPDLGNTCIATLALVRAGNTPQSGPYAANVARAVDFICKRVETADNDGLYVTDVRDTQLQSKIGPYVDTFLAGLVLAELKGKVPVGKDQERIVAALTKTVKKVEANQKADGTFAGNTGWASVISQGLASKFINRAAQQNVAIKSEVLERDYRQTVAQLDTKTGDFKAGAATKPAAVSGIAAAPTGSVAAGGRAPVAPVDAAPAGGSDAGVYLYNAASNFGRLSEFRATNGLLEAQASQVLADKNASPKDKEQAQLSITRAREVKQSQATAERGILARLEDKDFLAGFGNNGGEEFLSYMNISETLATKGGNDWQRWNNSICDNVGRIQNQDGSWSGHHCITGRTFCTSAALLVMMADRAPTPIQQPMPMPKPMTN